MHHVPYLLCKYKPIDRNRSDHTKFLYVSRLERDLNTALHESGLFSLKVKIINVEEAVDEQK